MESIYQDLFYIQQNLKVDKDRNNDFANFKYRSKEDIEEALKPLLKELNDACMISDEIVEIANRVYVKSTVILIKLDGKDSISTFAFAREQDHKSKMDDAQVTGTASSYAQKRAMCNLFLIDDGEPDLDSLDNSKPTQKTKQKIRQARCINCGNIHQVKKPQTTLNDINTYGKPCCSNPSYEWI